MHCPCYFPARYRYYERISMTRNFRRKQSMELWVCTSTAMCSASLEYFRVSFWRGKKTASLCLRSLMRRMLSEGGVLGWCSSATFGVLRYACDFLDTGSAGYRLISSPFFSFFLFISKITHQHANFIKKNLLFVSIHIFSSLHASVINEAQAYWSIL